MNVNIWNIYFELRMKDQIEERSSQLVRNLSSCEKEAWKNSDLNGEAWILFIYLFFCTI